MLKTAARFLLTAAVASLPSLALAHPESGSAVSFAHGFSHPVGGLDHVLAMVLVGMLAVQPGARAVWSVPLTFLSVMALGGLLGFFGVELTFVETGIAGSTVVLGAMLAFEISLPVMVVTLLTGFFALFHGHAHGAEMPSTAGLLAYVTGFIVATAGLHIAGLLAGLAFVNAWLRNGTLLLKGVGAAASLSGVAILFGVI
ncbi:HupE/UreJ family protein [Mesorhizobium sp. KR9-304]|uniref:HupE/UreJ family protein n=1 Tax=Mesorhizobium sp. KR9-304 TaxID=3156614 RepID=UPI0032B5A96B